MLQVRRPKTFMKGISGIEKRTRTLLDLQIKNVALINVSVLRPSSGQTIQNTENHQTFVDYTHIVWASSFATQVITQFTDTPITITPSTGIFPLNRALNNRERPVNRHPTRSSISKETEKEDIRGPSSLKKFR